MKRDIKMTSLFECRPGQWGLRGDPFLWDEMKEAIGEITLVESEDQLISLVENTFEQLTGVSLSSKDDILIERFKHGGMSSGYVSPEFWRNKAIPLLQERFVTMLQTKNKYKLLSAEGEVIHPKRCQFLPMSYLNN